MKIESSRVAITGIGMICSLGADRSQIWDSLLAGRSRTNFVSSFEPSEFGLENCIVAEVDQGDIDTAAERFPASLWVRDKHRFRKLVLAAATKAMEDARLRPNTYSGSGGCILGTMYGGSHEVERLVLSTSSRRKARVSDYIGRRPAVALQDIARLYSLRGPVFAIDATCASGAYALTQAAGLVATGRLPWCLAGGAEASLLPSILKGATAIKALSTHFASPTRASRPFDVQRSGYVPAEGAGFLLLENERHAVKRGARIYAYVSGMAEGNYTDHPTQVSEKLARSVMKQAINDANIQVNQLGWIKAHATSTRQGDSAEANAIRSLTEPHNIPCSALKSVTGHLLGASGAVEAAFAALSLHDQIIPPTINLESLDPECPVHCIRKATPSKFDSVLANSWGFGGTACSILLERA